MKSKNAAKLKMVSVLFSADLILVWGGKKRSQANLFFPILTRNDVVHKDALLVPGQ